MTEHEPKAESADDATPCRHTADRQAPHTCPYAEAIHGDSETLCTCCEHCEYQCSRDI